jgi:hypothetical protein
MSEMFLWFSDKDADKIRKKLAKRFSERTAHGCHTRPGSEGRNGYPTFTWKGTTYGAHRVAYAVWKEAVPHKWQVCHLCSNTQCVNPSHLALGTHGDNARDNARKTANLPRPDGLRGRLPEQPQDPAGVSWPPPLQAMAFPADTPRASCAAPPNRELLKLAFPASFKDED